MRSAIELDLLVIAGNRSLGFEIKRTATPRRTRSLHAARTTLSLDRTFIVHGGSDSFPLGDEIQAIAAARILEDLQPLA